MGEIIGYLIEPEEFTKLHGIANRLGDMQTLSHDQRRDLMNLLSLVLSRAMPMKEGE